jgi:DNA recombination protein Rad52
MAFTDTQQKALKAKLNHRHVKTRDGNGVSLAYVEGWHAIAEANRIFGFDSWDRQTLLPRCLWSEKQNGQIVCFYSTKVRITVRAGATVTAREGIGTGVGRSVHAEIAHELAAKAAETDATKRALSTFGNPFGLALYDRDHHNVTRPRGRHDNSRAVPLAPLVLTGIDGASTRHENGKDFVLDVQRTLSRLNSVECIYEFWSVNLAGLTELRRRSNEDGVALVTSIIGGLKNRLREVGGNSSANSGETPNLTLPEADLRLPPREPNSLLIPKEKRLRDRAHLQFVAGQPCLVCGRKPAQAHHLRFAQSRAMSLKVSDEFTLPLCNIHHDALHRSGDERAWWARHGLIDPLKIAARLWAASRNRSLDSRDERDGSVTQAACEVPGLTVSLRTPNQVSPKNGGSEHG